MSKATMPGFTAAAGCYQSDVLSSGIGGSLLSQRNQVVPASPFIASVRIVAGPEGRRRNASVLLLAY
jgi:hypothetical protein